MLLILSIYSHETKSLLLAIEKDDIVLFSLRSIPVRSCITAGSTFPDIREGINQYYFKKRQNEQAESIFVFQPFFNFSS